MSTLASHTALISSGIRTAPLSIQSLKECAVLVMILTQAIPIVILVQHKLSSRLLHERLSKYHVTRSNVHGLNRRD